jgi:hypothetical protein
VRGGSFDARQHCCGLADFVRFSSFLARTLGFVPTGSQEVAAQVISRAEPERSIRQRDRAGQHEAASLGRLNGTMNLRALKLRSCRALGSARPVTDFVAKSRTACPHEENPRKTRLQSGALAGC